jgi:hypothetical protein
MDAYLPPEKFKNHSEEWLWTSQVGVQPFGLTAKRMLTKADAPTNPIGSHPS